jgi:hypothetical protein
VADPIGEFEENYLVYSNDPKSSSITFTVTGNVKPPPAFVKRIGTVNLRHGVTIGNLNFWPTATPLVSVDQGEHFRFSLRVKSVEKKDAKIKIGTAEFENVTWKLRQESDVTTWIDFDVGPISQPGSISKSINVETDSPGKATIALTVVVIAENLIATPRSIDLPDLSLADLQGRDRVIGRFGLRKLIGEFQIKAITCTLTFIRVEHQSLVDGSNYVIRLTLEAARAKPGSYSGSVRVETDDPVKSLVEIPIKVRIVGR